MFCLSRSVNACYPIVQSGVLFVLAWECLLSYVCYSIVESGVLFVLKCQCVYPSVQSGVMFKSSSPQEQSHHTFSCFVHPTKLMTIAFLPDGRIDFIFYKRALRNNEITIP